MCCKWLLVLRWDDLAHTVGARHPKLLTLVKSHTIACSFHWDVSHMQPCIVFVILLSNDSIIIVSCWIVPTHLTEPHRSLSILVLLTELKDVTNFHMLGVYLQVPESRLTDIETRYLHSQGLDRCKKEVLSAWLQIIPGANWKELTDALREIDETALAAKLEDKYCQPSSTQKGNQFINMLIPVYAH